MSRFATFWWHLLLFLVSHTPFSILGLLDRNPRKCPILLRLYVSGDFFYRQVEKGLKRESTMSTSYFEINSKLFCVHFIVSYCLVDVNTEESLVDRFVSTTGYCLTWKIWNIVQCSCYSTLLILYTSSIEINYVKDKR